MDKIIIRDLRVNALIGTLPHEQLRRQELDITLELELDLAPAGETDDLTLSVDYSEIERRVAELAENSRFKLLEALGSAIEKILLEYPLLAGGTIRIVKPRALRNSVVEIVVNFSRDGRDGR